MISTIQYSFGDLALTYGKLVRFVMLDQNPNYAIVRFLKEDDIIKAGVRGWRGWDLDNALLGASMVRLTNMEPALRSMSRWWIKAGATVRILPLLVQDSPGDMWHVMELSDGPCGQIMLGNGWQTLVLPADVLYLPVQHKQVSLGDWVDVFNWIKGEFVVERSRIREITRDGSIFTNAATPDSKAWWHRIGDVNPVKDHGMGALGDGAETLEMPAIEVGGLE